MYQTIDRLASPKDAPLYLWFEPWAEGLAFPAGMTIELHAQSEIEGRLEIDETSERTAVYGWAGSTLKLIVNGEEVARFDQAVPEKLSQLSTKDSIQLLFGSPPIPNARERAKWKKKPWWKIWD
ncbi:hypothetical protein [Undibacterium flavidum]|uniref:Uncharacterized protein n=1 Tax=Undibacterium flavidum TaxID=2762297 RepID=A0ABR6YAJ8_9BURK|nr:hypothetical protein [Undibacterium flavidum]MBC3873587.1 hypothetical protein [Undibacterium flavidum]